MDRSPTSRALGMRPACNDAIRTRCFLRKEKEQRTALVNIDVLSREREIRDCKVGVEGTNVERVRWNVCSIRIYYIHVTVTNVAY